MTNANEKLNALIDKENELRATIEQLESQLKEFRTELHKVEIEKVRAEIALNFAK